MCVWEGGGFLFPRSLLPPLRPSAVTRAQGQGKGEESVCVFICMRDERDSGGVTETEQERGRN